MTVGGVQLCFQGSSKLNRSRFLPSTFSIVIIVRAGSGEFKAQSSSEIDRSSCEAVALKGGMQ